MKDDEWITFEGQQVLRGDLLIIYPRTTWEKIKLWWYQLWNKPGTYTVTEIGDANNPYVLTRDDLHPKE